MNKVEKAVEVLNKNGILIFPTDTAFGIGCRIDSEAAVKKLFKIRKRPEAQATSVLVSSIEMAEKYLTPLSDNVRRIMKNYWPGGLTIVYPAKISVTPPLVRGNGATLGVRQPDHDLTLALINKVGVPILGPSANFHGDPTPYKFSDLNPELVKLVDYVISGITKTKIASTVIDCSVTPWKILRQGSIDIKI